MGIYCFGLMKKNHDGIFAREQMGQNLIFECNQWLVFEANILVEIKNAHLGTFF